MTEFSWVYDCAVGGDATALSQELIADTWRLVGTRDPSTQGVIDTAISPYGSFLAPSNPGANTMRIAPGAAIVNGYFYTSGGDVDFDVTVGSGGPNSTNYIVLRSTPATGLVRLAYTSSPPVTGPAVWEVPIATILLDGAGNLFAFIDSRSFAQTSLQPRRERVFFVPISSVWDVNAGTEDTRRTASSAVILVDAMDMSAAGHSVVPLDFLSFVSAEALFFAPTGVTGDIAYGFDEDDYNCESASSVVIPAASSTFTVSAPNNPSIIQCASYNLVGWSAVAGEPFYISFRRDALDVADTLNDDITLNGFRITYLASG